MKPDTILRNIKTFLETQSDGFLELVQAHKGTPAEAACQEAADEARTMADTLGPVFAVMESRDVVLNHVRSTMEAAILAELEKTTDRPSVEHLMQALNMVLPVTHG